MLLLGGFTHAPLQLGGKNFLRKLRVPCIQDLQRCRVRHDRRFSSIVAKVVVENGGPKRNVRRRKVSSESLRHESDQEKGRAAEDELSKAQVSGASRNAGGRRFKAEVIDGELHDETIPVSEKSEKRATRKNQRTIKENAPDDESGRLKSEEASERRTRRKKTMNASTCAVGGEDGSSEQITHEKRVTRRKKPEEESAEGSRKWRTKKLEAGSKAATLNASTGTIVDLIDTAAASTHVEQESLASVVSDACLARESMVELKKAVVVSSETSDCPAFDLNQAMEMSSGKTENCEAVEDDMRSNKVSQASNSAPPLYLQIEKRRLEEQERRASSTPPRKKKFSPESEIRFTLDNCSKFGDVNGALALYYANRDTFKFDLYGYNVLLYLCSSGALGVLAPGKQSRQRPDFLENQAQNGTEAFEEDAVEEDGVVLRGSIAGLSGKNVMGFTGEMMDMFLTKGLDIYEKMLEENLTPNEATFTALARLAVAKHDGDLAFAIVKAMITANIPPKLRCYGPALYVYFKQKDANKAFEVYNHMLLHNVQPDEAELELFLQLSSRAGLSDRVYSLLHHLRETVRDVSQSTVGVIEQWFRSDAAASATGKFQPEELDVKKASLERGGGWHGLGWLGQGRWKVEYTNLSKDGVCSCCKEQLVTIDIDPEQTDSFAKCVASLAFKRENNNSFGAFKDWLDKNGPYETVVDGANVGFYNQRLNGELNFAQLNSVVTEVQRRSGKWPLVVLHVGRTQKGSGRSNYAQQVLRHWSSVKALYIAPTGSNDDWYWLYAAVKSKALLISNDEMRDHIFQLLGRELFPTWKERHQVRFHVTRNGPTFYMPPPYSILIQEAPRGSWHIPVSGGDEITSPRKWLCVTRGSA